MTTIAWDGRTLAVDRQLTQDGKRFTTTKAWQLKDGRIFASCGALEDNIAVRDWLNGVGERPSFKPDERFDGVLVDKDQLYVCGPRLTWSPIHDAVYATGSGGDFAATALRLGKSAREAVEMASQIDIWSGMGVTELTVADGE